MKRLLRFGLLLSLAGGLPSAASARLQVVTTTEDLSALAREVGQDLVEAFPIARGYQDPHFVDAKPSYLLRLKRARLLIVVGLELEVGWLPALLQNARNGRILPGNPGYLDASSGCIILQKPDGPVDRSQGDVHPFGNPHYWTDPENGRLIARHIADRLASLDPQNEARYRENLKSFEKRLDDKQREWQAAAVSFNRTRIVTYHNSWPNFARAFDLVVANHIEPKPGVPPSPAHLQALIGQMRRENIRVILMEPYFDEKLPRRVAERSGAAVVVFPPSVGGAPEIRTYFDLFDYNLRRLREALGGRP